MKRFFSMRLLGVMAIAAIALSNVFLAACSEDDDMEMNSSTLAEGLMTRAGERDPTPQPREGVPVAAGDTTIKEVSIDGFPCVHFHQKTSCFLATLQSLYIAIL